MEGLAESNYIAMVCIVDILSQLEEHQFEARGIEVVSVHHFEERIVQFVHQFMQELLVHKAVPQSLDDGLLPFSHWLLVETSRYDVCPC